MNSTLLAAGERLTLNALNAGKLRGLQMNDFTKGWHADMSPEDSKNLAYWERNMLALMIASTHAGHECCGLSGWYHHGEYKDWSRVISIGNGSITFHVPDDFDLGNLKQIEPNWNGHTTQDKWRYIMKIVGIKNE